MSDENYTSTPTIDYSDYEDYYSMSTVAAPCHSPEIMDFGRVFLTLLYSLVFVTGFIGNGLVVCVLVKHRRQSTLTDVCLFNLAVSDLLFVQVLPLYTHFVMVRRWTLGDFMCRLAGGVHSTGYFSSVFFMVVMTLDRYLVIMHGNRVASYRTMRAGLTLSAVVWALSLGVSLPAFVFTGVTGTGEEALCGYNPSADFWKQYEVFSLTVLGLLVPLLAMMLCYSRIIPVLVRMRSAKRHRAVKVVIAIVVVFFVLWGPYNIAVFLEFLLSEGKLDGGCDFTRNLQLSIVVTETLAYTHCCLNPIIYAFVGQKFTKRAVQMLKSCLPAAFRLASRDSESSFRRSSVVSRSSDATFVM